MSAELRSYNDKLMPDNRRRVLHTPCNREVIDENNNGEYLRITRYPPTHAITHAAVHVVYRHCILSDMSALFSPLQIYAFRRTNPAVFSLGNPAAEEAMWAGNTLPAKTQQAIVRITGTDNMTTHYGQITHLQGKRIFPAQGIVLYGQYLPGDVCAGQTWAMTLKVRAVHGQLNEGGFDSQRYALAQHQPLTGRFLQASVITPQCSLRSRYLASLKTALTDYHGSRSYWVWEWGSACLCHKR